MIRKLKIFYRRRLKRFFARTFGRITAINKKYAKPQIEMKSSVKISLTALLFYLLFIIGLLVYKFIITII